MSFLAGLTRTRAATDSVCSPAAGSRGRGLSSLDAVCPAPNPTSGVAPALTRLPCCRRVLGAAGSGVPGGFWGRLRVLGCSSGSGAAAGSGCLWNRGAQGSGACRFWGAVGSGGASAGPHWSVLLSPCLASGSQARGLGVTACRMGTQGARLFLPAPAGRSPHGRNHDSRRPSPALLGALGPGWEVKFWGAGSPRHCFNERIPQPWLLPVSQRSCVPIVETRVDLGFASVEKFQT